MSFKLELNQTQMDFLTGCLDVVLKNQGLAVLNQVVDLHNLMVLATQPPDLLPFQPSPLIPKEKETVGNESETERA